MDALGSRYLPILRTHFGHHSLRDTQAAAITALLKGKDVLLTAPTGHGKSLCFQLPALVQHLSPPTLGSVTLVVTPLLSLMHNQVAALTARNIPCALLSSSETPAANQAVLTALTAPKPPPYALLYITPEKLVTPTFMSTLRALHTRRRLAFLAVDEAHCISQWGHDFRPAYAALGLVKDAFPSLPVLAATATATKPVQRDILTSLGIPSAIRVHTSFLRANIRYECRYADAMSLSVEHDIADYILRRRTSAGFERGIIYAFKTDTVDHLAALLTRRGIPAAAYHGKLPPALRKAAQASFEAGTHPVIVASTAFGMGIDVRDIRYVLHHSLPRSVEAFYQESGRAGRDGRPAASVLYYAERDAHFVAYVQRAALQHDSGARATAAADALAAMKAYATRASCRRVALLHYFGESAAPRDVCGPHGCDVCHNRADVLQRMRIRVDLRTGRPRGNAGARTTTPAADFQSARSLLKAEEQQKAAGRARAEKRPRSILKADDIGDFSSGEEQEGKVSKKVDLVLAGRKASAGLRALARAEEAESAAQSMRLKRPRDRLLHRLNSGNAANTVDATSSKRKKRAFGRAATRPFFRPASHEGS